MCSTYVRAWRHAAGLCLALCAALLAGVAFGAPTAGQEPARASEGREVFQTYCASCHGADGAGHGPVAASMRRAPPDITAIALANGGAFPNERIRRIIDGRDVESHGNREMPVWGDAFKATRGGHSEDAIRARIDAVVRYLASIQRQRA